MKLSKIFVSATAFFTMFLICFSSENYSAGLLDMVKVLKSSAACDEKAYPNSDTVLVDDYIKINYKTDGTGEKWDDTVVKILTDKGREDYKILSFNYTLPYSRVEIKKLDIIKPDGRTISVDAKANSREMVDNSQMFANIYNPNDKILKVTIPELEIGDLIRYVICETTFKAIIPDEWFDLEILESTSPVMSFRYEVTAPKKKPVLKKALLDPVSDTVSFTTFYDADKITYVWEAKDVPRMFPEPNMPPLYSVVQRVLCSTINSWEDVSKWYWNLCEPRLNATTPEMVEFVQELVKDSSPDMEKIKAIYYFVAQKVRYMGVTTEDEAPGFEPHDVSITFNNRYGVCRDKAALLVSMLRIAGFKAYPVLIMVGPKLDKSVPLPYFNHAVSCVELSDGKMVFMDSTIESSKEIFPAYLCDKSYLIAKPDGATLETTPIIPAKENLLKITTKASLNAAGTIDAGSVIDFDGINDSLYRGHFAELSNDERRNFFENVLRRALPDSRLFYYSITPENIFDMNEPLRVTLRYLVRNSIVRGDDIDVLSLPWIGNTIGIVNFVIGKTGLTERKYPLVTDIACGYEEKIQMELPDELKIEEAPLFREIDSETVTYNRSVKINKNDLTADSEFMIKVVEFSPEEYLNLREYLKTIEFNNKIRVVGKLDENSSESSLPKEKETDARIISRIISAAFAEDGTITETKNLKTKILTYKGKKDNSEIKIRYNEAWEKVNLIKAWVISSSGRTQKIDTTEINIMDAPWVASAPRYPAEKIKVLSLPGVEVGSVIEVEYELISKGKPFYSDRFSPRSRYPVDKYEFSLLIPEKIRDSFNMSSFKCSNINKTVREEGGKVAYKWEALSEAPLAQEIAVPPLWVYLPSVIISNGNWEEYGAELINRFNELTEDNPKCAELSASLIKDKKSDEEKIKAVRDYIEINIRRAGPSFTELPLSALSKPDVTLRDGYGNSADTALLYASLLKCAGFKDVSFILVSNLPDINEVVSPVTAVPQRDLFDYILVRLTDSEGNQIYLNDTDQYSAYGAVRHEGSAGILAGTDKVIRIEPAKGKETRSEVMISTLIMKDSSAELAFTKKLYGNEYGDDNRLFSQLTQEEQSRHYKELIGSIAQSAVSAEDFKYNFNSYPGVETFKIKIPDYIVSESGINYFNAYSGGIKIFTLGAMTRFYPYYISDDVRFRLANTIVFPEDTEQVLIKPSSCNLVIPGGAGKVFVSSMPGPGKGSKVYYNVTEYQVAPAIVSQEEYSRLIDIQDYLISEQNSMYLYKTKSSGDVTGK